MSGTRDHNDPEWVAERWRSVDEGGLRHWGETQKPRVRSESKALRETEKARAVLDVLCHGRWIARVLGSAVPGEYELAFEVVGAGGGRGVYVHGEHVGGYSGSGKSLNLRPVGGTNIVVGCRCRAGTHALDPGKLKQQAGEGKPGSPRRVGAATVSATY